MRKFLILFIRAYQYLISPLLGPQCRFYPSCSSYAQTALERHGLVRGGWLALCRMARCHPWHAGGEDYVPEKMGRSDDKKCHSCAEPTLTLKEKSL